LKPSPEGEGQDEGIHIATYWGWYKAIARVFNIFSAQPAFRSRGDIKIESYDAILFFELADSKGRHKVFLIY